LSIAANADTYSQCSMRTEAAEYFGNMFQRNATSAINLGRLAPRKSSNGSISQMKRRLSKWWPRMACSSLCGFTDEMRRPHLSCLWCRVRRLFYGKLDSNKYHKNRYLPGVVFPLTYYNYVLCIDTSPGRRFKKVKDFLLKHLLTICEGLAN
jgi:hypothetical protein